MMRTDELGLLGLRCWHHEDALESVSFRSTLLERYKALEGPEGGGKQIVRADGMRIVRYTLGMESLKQFLDHNRTYPRRVNLPS